MGELDGRVALVAGATRGAGRGIALELGAAGAHVYVTGRSTRKQRSEYNRPETIEETAELIEAEGGRATAIGADHLDVTQVRAVIDRIDREQGRLDLLVNDIWGGEGRFEWEAPLWETDLQRGLRLLHLAVDTHLITSHTALPGRLLGLHAGGGRDGRSGSRCRVHAVAADVVAASVEVRSTRRCPNGKAARCWAVGHVRHDRRAVAADQ